MDDKPIGIRTKKHRTYPPPTNNVCCRLSPRLEVLLQLLMRALSCLILLLKCLDGAEKEGSAIV
jgi:hypothetical protein